MVCVRWLLPAVLIWALVAPAMSAEAPTIEIRCTLDGGEVVQACVDSLRDAAKATTYYDQLQGNTRAEKALEARREEVRAQAAKDETRRLRPLPAAFAGDRMPKGWVPDSVLGLLKQLAPKPRKGEFETTEQFEPRMTAWEAQPFKSRPARSGPLVFEQAQGLAGDSFVVEYDADRVVVKASFRHEDVSALPGTGRLPKTFENYKKLGTVNAKTRMGIPFRVDVWDASFVCLVMGEGWGSVMLEVPLTRDAAPVVKPRLRAAVVAAADPPFDAYHSHTATASLDSPREVHFSYFGLQVVPIAVLLFDPKDGRIYARKEAPF